MWMWRCADVVCQVCGCGFAVDVVCQVLKCALKVLSYQDLIVMLMQLCTYAYAFMVLYAFLVV
jgi:hypothetical protein